MKLFRLDHGEVCSNWSSDDEDWDMSGYFINLDRVTCLEDREYKLPNGHKTSWYVWLDGTVLGVTKEAFDRIRLTMEST